MVISNFTEDTNNKNLKLLSIKFLKYFLEGNELTKIEREKTFQIHAKNDIFTYAG